MFKPPGKIEKGVGGDGTGLSNIENCLFDRKQ